MGDLVYFGIDLMVDFMLNRWFTFHMCIQSAVSLFGTQAALAEALGVSSMAVSKWMSGKARVTAERAVDIERVTGARVTRYDLRPDIFGPPPGGEVAA